MSHDVHVIGIDCGTDSIRSLIVNALDGRILSSAVHNYTRWREGRYCDPARNRFRHHPLDYIEGIEKTIGEALAQAPPGTAETVRGISVDTTGSTPVVVDEAGTPLALKPGFEENPNAMFILWKDHTAVEEAAQINDHARSWGEVDVTRYVGGVYSSEWFWAKLLHVLREDEQIRSAAYSVLELCDWIPAQLIGSENVMTVRRGRCAAGHKAMWHESYGGLPPEEFFAGLDPLLEGFRSRLYSDTYTNDEKCGMISPRWAKRLGLPGDTVIGIGAFDAHMGAIGAEIKPSVLTKIIGTSTCDILIAPKEEVGDKLISGICGQVDGSVLPGMVGMEAGQSCVGDLYAWFRDILMWPLEHVLAGNTTLSPQVLEELREKSADRIIPALSALAEKVPVDESGVVALDWLNGRRTPFANQRLKGVIAGLTLGSDAPRVFRALVESTAFGARKIVERFTDEGIPITGVIALGGVAKKDPFVMQVHADVLNMSIKVVRSEQACALGAAMCAATAAGIHPTLEDAQVAMGSGFETEYRPDAENARRYDSLYRGYSRLGDFFEEEFMR